MSAIAPFVYVNIRLYLYANVRIRSQMFVRDRQLGLIVVLPGWLR